MKLRSRGRNKVGKNECMDYHAGSKVQSAIKLRVVEPTSDLEQLELEQLTESEGEPYAFNRHRMLRPLSPGNSARHVQLTETNLKRHEAYLESQEETHHAVSLQNERKGLLNHAEEDVAVQNEFDDLTAFPKHQMHRDDRFNHLHGLMEHEYSERSSEDEWNVLLERLSVTMKTVQVALSRGSQLIYSVLC